MKNEHFKILLLISLPIFAFGPLNSHALSNVNKQKRKLTSIQKQIELKQKELKKYKKKEGSIRKELKSLKKEERRAFYNQRKVNKLLSDTRKKSVIVKSEYKSLKSASRQWTGALENELMLYFFKSQTNSPYYGKLDLMEEISLKSVIIEKSFIVAKAKGVSLKMRKGILKLEKKDVELKGKRTAIVKKRRFQKKKVASKRSELSKTKKEYKKKLKEVEELKSDAKSLLWLIKKLEKRSPYKKRMPANKKQLSIAKHSLSWPVQGKVISKFGRENIPFLKTWIVREGIRIETQFNKAVFPAMGGKILYSGPFRSYGNVVIIDHEIGFFTVYGLLKSISVKKDEVVDTGTVIGKTGVDTQAISRPKKSNSGVVYFEIRSGTNALNPLIWLK